VVWQLRAPRALAGFAVGAGLALSGALLQGLLRNPLADPYVLGISGGAAVGALVAIALGLPVAAVQVGAALGAVGTLALLFGLARRALFRRDALESEHGTATVLLTGVMIASFAAALLSLVLSLAPDARLRTMVFWLLGDLAGATDLRASAVALAVIGAAVAFAWRQAAALNLMVRGDLQAYTQGVRVVRTRRTLVLVAALATGAAVTLAGAVGFVGFVAPHLVRLVAGNDQRVLLPASTLAGGTLVVLADTVARSAFAPLQLPVGVLTALIGVPVFLWLLARR
jgi:iron complex transport system permease protein